MGLFMILWIKVYNENINIPIFIWVVGIVDGMYCILEFPVNVEKLIRLFS